MELLTLPLLGLVHEADIDLVLFGRKKCYDFKRDYPLI
jgi:hypothetical protein